MTNHALVDPDDLARALVSNRSALSAVLSSDAMDPWTLIELRRALRCVDIKARATTERGFHSLEHLPPELITRIADGLTLHDLLTTRLVSRPWKETMWQPLLCLTIAREGFLGLEQLHAHENIHKTLEGAILAHLALVNRSVGGQGALHAIPFYEATPMVDNSKRPLSAIQGRFVESGKAPACLYRNKRLAFQPSKDKIVIDDLENGTRRGLRLTVDVRKATALQLLAAFSGQVVATVELQGPESGSRYIHVYDTTSTQSKRIVLPTHLFRCFATRQTVAAVCRGGQVMVVNAQRTVEEILPESPFPSVSVQGQPNKAPFHGLPAVVMHPWSDDNLFLVWTYIHSPWGDVDDDYSQLHEYAICEYSRNNGCWTEKSIVRHQRRLARNEWELAPSESRIILTQDCHVVDNCGSFQLATYTWPPRTTMPGQPCEGWSERVYCNVLTRAFWGTKEPISGVQVRTARRRHAPSLPTPTWDVMEAAVTCTWNQTLYSVREETSASQIPYSSGSADTPPPLVLDTRPVVGNWRVRLNNQTSATTFARPQGFSDLLDVWVDDDFLVLACESGYLFRFRHPGRNNGWIPATGIGNSHSQEPLLSLNTDVRVPDPPPAVSLGESLTLHSWSDRAAEMTD
ncbi:uncharacterized protein F5Z01DRAFT_690579 [Emericellopsis atlantica]|uniref:F-box domain-containing protein n=1 Tax=Emericellopsis atlantica TaxID=2614577 RepID=A0A9P7ZHT6_9HYPO|nr:uncharacterized protein F5Z01DRAFT_690579 [Emericellopsis atlantica]KAG9252379.1 hypothetical protein F5Z01DRAFT_690579 [Emericellopsis atlantica]